MPSLYSRFLEWKDETARQLRQKWWWAVVVIPFAIIWALLQDRLVSATNRYLDAHLFSSIHFSISVPGGLFPKLLIGAAVSLLSLMALLLIHAYWETRPSIRSRPKFTATEFVRNDARTADGHYSAYFQVLPKCLSPANVEQCIGFLTSIEMQDAATGQWSTKDIEAMPLEWSLGYEANGHLPTTLYSGGVERRLNVFFIHNIERRIRPCVHPFPLSLNEMFDPSRLSRVGKIKFSVTMKGKDCPDVRLVMIVRRSGDPMQPEVTVQAIS